MTTSKTKALRVKRIASDSRPRAESEPRNFPITMLLGNVLIAIGVLALIGGIVVGIFAMIGGITDAVNRDQILLNCIVGATGGLLIAASGESMKLLASSHRLLRIIAIEAQGEDQPADDWKEGTNAS